MLVVVVVILVMLVEQWCLGDKRWCRDLFVSARCSEAASPVTGARPKLTSPPNPSPLSMSCPLAKRSACFSPVPRAHTHLLAPPTLLLRKPGPKATLCCLVVPVTHPPLPYLRRHLVRSTELLLRVRLPSLRARWVMCQD